MSSAVHPWPQRSLRVLVAATWFVLAAVLSAPSLADDAIAKESHGAVQEGRQLELGRKWNRAFEHYEAALKRWPDVASLKHGLRRSRIQCTIARRYTDYSFHTSLIGLSRSDAMTLFDETLRKVSSNFVEQISLTSFVAHGTESVYLSLANQKFLDRHLRNTKTGDSSAVPLKPIASSVKSVNWLTVVWVFLLQASSWNSFSVAATRWMITVAA